MIPALALLLATPRFQLPDSALRDKPKDNNTSELKLLAKFKPVLLGEQHQGLVIDPPAFVYDLKNTTAMEIVAAVPHLRHLRFSTGGPMWIPMCIVLKNLKVLEVCDFSAGVGKPECWVTIYREGVHELTGHVLGHIEVGPCPDCKRGGLDKSDNG